MKKKIIDAERFNMIRQSFPYCIMIPLHQKNININNTTENPKYYARTLDGAYSYAINYAKRYMDIDNIEKNKIYYDENSDIKYFVNTIEEVLKTGKVWRYKINDDSYYYCDIIKKSITFSNEDIIFTNNTYREEIIKIYNFTLRKINNNIIYQDYGINANIYYDYVNKCYGDYLSYNVGEKFNNLEEGLTNYFAVCNLLLKNRDIVYKNIKNNTFTVLDREKFMNNKKVIFREILIFTKNL
jgi:hypothetical protein